MLVIVGSRDLWVTPEIVGIVLGKIAASDPIDTLGVRVPRGADDPTSMLEQFVAKLGPDLGRVITRFQPPSNKREDVYRRDWRMVQNARQVLAMFAPDQEMEGGTGHVVQAALGKGIPVEAYRINEVGRPELLGSDDGAWGPVPDLGGVNGSLYTGKYTSTTNSANFDLTDWIKSGHFTLSFDGKP